VWPREDGGLSAARKSLLTALIAYDPTFLRLQFFVPRLSYASRAMKVEGWRVFFIHLFLGKGGGVLPPLLPAFLFVVFFLSTFF